MLAVTMCHGNCSACKVRRTVAVNKASRQVADLRMASPAPVGDVPVEVSSQETMQTTEGLVVADEIATQQEASEESVQTGIVLYEPSGQVETYKIAKTRKGLIGKLMGGSA